VLEIFFWRPREPFPSVHQQLPCWLRGTARRSFPAGCTLFKVTRDRRLFAASSVADLLFSPARCFQLVF
jgi:hypothetical protein